VQLEFIFLNTITACNWH